MLPVLLRRTVLTVVGLVFFALEGGFSVNVSGQHGGSPVNLHGSLINRTAATHPTGRGVFALGNLLRIGGVLSQADSLIDLSGNPVSVRVELAADQPYPGHIDVYRTGSTMRYEYPIEYNDLVPMALFVDSGGTSLYTLWESDSGRFPPDFERDAGFVNHRLQGMIALEFQGTRYSDAVHFLDTCRWTCTDPAGADLDPVVGRINSELGRVRYDDIDFLDVMYIRGTYINTDVDLPFQVSMDGDLLSVNGNVARLHPNVSDNRIVIDDATRIFTSERLPDVARERISLVSRASEMLAGAVDAREAVTLRLLMDEAAREIVLEFTTQEVEDAHFLFETLALLRSAKESSPDDWKHFRQALESDILVRENPEPWYDYSRSFCSLYSDDDDCQN